MPPNTVKVDRSTLFGNPFRIGDGRDAADVVEAFHQWLTVPGIDAGLPDRKAAIIAHLSELRGKDLACWCHLDQPCHADVLLSIANA